MDFTFPYTKNKCVFALLNHLKAQPDHHKIIKIWKLVQLKGRDYGHAFKYDHDAHAYLKEIQSSNDVIIIKSCLYIPKSIGRQSATRLSS